MGIGCLLEDGQWPFLLPENWFRILSKTDSVLGGSGHPYKTILR